MGTDGTLPKRPRGKMEKISKLIEFCRIHFWGVGLMGSLVFMLEKIPNRIKLQRKPLIFNKNEIEMSIQTISVDFPKDILLALNESENDLKKQIKLTLAIELYKVKKLTIGKAAQISGMSRFEFEKELSKNKISISNLDEEDVLSDIEKLK